MLIAIVIPACNEEKILPKTAEKIKYTLTENADDAIDWELIICNNNSTDNTAKLAATLAHKVTFEPINLARLFASNFLAVILFILPYLLPKRLIRALGARLLGYWYKDGR